MVPAVNVYCLPAMHDSEGRSVRPPAPQSAQTRVGAAASCLTLLQFSVICASRRMFVIEQS